MLHMFHSNGLYARLVYVNPPYQPLECFVLNFLVCSIQLDVMKRGEPFVYEVKGSGKIGKMLMTGTIDVYDVINFL